MIFLEKICILLAIVYVRVFADIPEVSVDQGQNLSVACALPSAPATGAPEAEPESQGGYMWIRGEREERQNERLQVQPDGTLVLMEVNRNDSGVYQCSMEGDKMNGTYRVKVVIRTTPPELENVRIHPSTILALILWEVKETGGYPIIHFTAEYKLATDEEWMPITPNHISPNSRQIDVYKLEPNTTYAFRIWAVNQLGKGEVTTLEGHTRKVYEEIELARHFLAGAENFDTRVWVVAVGIVMGTLTVLGLGTCYLLYLECRSPPEQLGDEQEIIELVPNIILNPGFEENGHTEQNGNADENSNNETTIRLNNNTVVQPRNV